MGTPMVGILLILNTSPELQCQHSSLTAISAIVFVWWMCVHERGHPREPSEGQHFHYGIDSRFSPPFLPQAAARVRHEVVARQRTLRATKKSRRQKRTDRHTDTHMHTHTSLDTFTPLYVSPMGAHTHASPHKPTQARTQAPMIRGSNTRKIAAWLETEPKLRSTLR